ncbi:AbfB domain-containing protein [Streptomyces sp. KAU_LT]|uniref:AbfB domain-containing protein n=1 Tax=Streptomyces sp. KAU_LT TaxID=3046669 RepID=UPI0024B7EFC1|nr:AbfB domain-containing protein [Streptomyces sp. KAU_LT]MDI9834080.1 AbfB domain-containing protein [Streptomyces sp. KAU_LT]
MPDNASRPSPEPPVWEDGWTPDTSRAPGTRRLWLAGALAVATIVACATALTVSGKESDAVSAAPTPSRVDVSVPGLISFATPSQTPPAGRSGMAPGQSESPAGGRTDASPSASAPSTSPSAEAEPSSAHPSSPPSAHSPLRSVRAVNYPDRQWHVTRGAVRLDPVGSGRRSDVAFRLVAGLADASCHSFATADGRYLRHRDFLLREDRDDGSALFRRDATFCPRSSPHSGAVMLESVNHRGRFLRHRDFRLRLDPYQRDGLFLADSSFRIVDAPGA